MFAASPAPHTSSVHADDVVGISMVNNTFSPRSVTVTAGTTVIWESDADSNGTDVEHDLLADDYSSWGSDHIAPGGTFARTFSSPGTCNYVCDLHDRMETTIIVQ
jgi:plastocyanin